VTVTEHLESTCSHEPPGGSNPCYAPDTTALRAPVSGQLPKRGRHESMHALNCQIRSINEGRSTENVNRIVRRARLGMTEAHRTEKWWTPEQLRLVEDTARSWVRTTFSPSDMLLIRRQPGEGSMGRRARPDEQPGPDRKSLRAAGITSTAHCVGQRSLPQVSITAKGTPTVRLGFALRASTNTSLRG
jgi:hypothetical protein